MSSRSALWRSIGSTKQRSQKEVAIQSTLPRKFMPTRDKSESVDKIFDLSRMRMNSSSDQRSTLNVSRQNQKVIKEKTPSKKLVTFSRAGSQVKQQLLQQNSVNHSTLKSNTILKIVRGVDSNQGIAQIRREFLLFKQNVLQELQRQKELVNKLVKQIILTMEFQLQKIGKVISPELYEMKPVVEVSGECLRSIENWKESLQQTNVLPIDSKIKPEFDLVKMGSLKKKETCNSTIESQIGPPLPLVDFSGFLSGLGKLRNQMNEMEKICVEKERLTQLQFKNIR